MALCVLLLKSVSPQDRPRIGSKAFHLSELIKGGFLVPDGVCITTEAYSLFVEEAAPSLERLGEISPEDIDGIRRVGGTIRTALLQADIPGVILKDLYAALDTLCTEKFAVRSSASTEDLEDRSFAGQQDSFLDIDRADLPEAIKRCWASLFSDRAIAYRLANEIREPGVMGVIIQEMIRPDPLGIMFTADPVSGNRQRIVVEAGCPPVCYAYNKSQALWSHPDGPLPLSVLERLAEIGKALELQYQAPQDIEWCLSENRVFILQTRPITTLFPLPDPLPSDRRTHYYYCWNYFQGMLAPFSPLGEDLLARASRGFGLQGKHFVVTAGGRIYYDLTDFLAVPMLSRLAARLFRSAVDPVAAQAFESLPKGRASLLNKLGIYFFATGYALRLLGPFLGALFGREPRKLRQREEKEAARAVGRIQRHLERCEPGFPRVRKAFKLSSRLWSVAVPPKFFAQMGASLVAQSLAARYGENVLLSPESVTARMDEAIAELALLARSSPSLWEKVREPHSFLEILDLPLGPDFMLRYQAFLQDYGMRGPGEIDIANPRWKEDPEALWNLIRTLEPQPAPPHKTPAGHFSAVAEELWGLRELPKFTIVRILDFFKIAFLQWGEMLYQAGMLEEPRDVFYLVEADLSRFPKEYAALAQARKELWKRYSRLKPPRILSSEGESMGAPQSETGVVLHGVPISAGVVEGLARIVDDPREAKLEPGEILVIPYADPGWSPLFSFAAGLVMEEGGGLTHGAILAREFGIPAVAAIPEVTRRIKNGQRVRVDGSRGWLILLTPSDRGS